MPIAGVFRTIFHRFRRMKPAGGGGGGGKGGGGAEGAGGAGGRLSDGITLIRPLQHRFNH